MNTYKEKTITLLIPWMGDWPWYFSYFLHSCKFNPSIDYILLSDNKSLPIQLPDNVRIIPYSYEQFNKTASNVLNLEIKVSYGYKLCDFKPAFGYIFSDLIKGCDFWGYCDIDIIWGNIRAFMTDEILAEYDIISARHDYLAGCFALYRNNSQMRELFKESKDYIRIFTSSENFFFDETNFAFKEFGIGLHYSQIKTEIESMTHVVRRLQESNSLKAYFEFQIVEGFAGNMLWDKGTLIYRKEFEAMCYHMVRFKRKYSEESDINKEIPNKFRIGKKKIY
ncbi:DUF6625 family protein [Dysgonomonas sp. ZJ709]|uniref:DUF6625 family protein n=1 Tax=Dysgonomonas sp. ZJ709 TaxID=2709797 RepID=UPI0013EA77DB|nr:DUF6625 family protein [Dysgonomonas sp. ZJ709]